MIKRVNNFSLDTVGRVYVKLYGQISRVSRDGKKTLDSNVSIVRKKISQSLSDNDLYGLSMSIPIKLSFSDCAELIKRLSLDNIFHPFIREERVLALHLAPCRLWSFLSPECTAAERMIFTRCLVAAIRSQALEDCGELAFAFLGKYLGLSRVGPVEGLTVKGEDKTLENDKIANCKKVLAGRLREEYEKASVTVDPEMIGCSSPDWSKTPTGVYEALKTAFEGRDGDGVLSLDTDLAVALIRHLFPEGTFHMYTGAEYVLMNSLSPVGRKLTDGEEFFWMECLMGAQRSFHINGNIAHPLRYFDWKKYLPEGFNDDGKNLADKKLK
ncbi:MAG: hypothetical protein LBB63_00855 [Holosporaceae bacterium]|nr:hypothetical protein [Holosporaceae bacterium]